MYEAVSKSFSSESKVPSEKDSANALKLACNLNGSVFFDVFDPFVSDERSLPLAVRAQCCIKTGQWKDAAKLAEDCLLIDRSNLKVSPSMSNLCLNSHVG